MRAVFAIALGLALSPLPALAQQQPPQSGSGAATASGDLLMDRIALLLERVDNPAVLRSIHLGDPEKERERRTEDTEIRAEIAEHRRTCRGDVRRANRDKRMETILRCYRAEMTLGLVLLRNERDGIVEQDALTTDARDDALDALDALMDASLAIVDGIDLGVYATEEALVHAKANLRDKYRVPHWRAGQRVSADLLRAWLQLLIRRTRDVLADRPERGERERAAVTCLETAVDAALTARNTGERDIRARAAVLRDVRLAAGSCDAALKDLALPPPPPPEEGA